MHVMCGWNRDLKGGIWPSRDDNPFKRILCVNEIEIIKFQIC